MNGQFQCRLLYHEPIIYYNNKIKNIENKMSVKHIKYSL